MKIETKEQLMAAINQLRKCAIEHNEEELEDGQICTAMLCDDVAEYLEELITDGLCCKRADEYEISFNEEDCMAYMSNKTEDGTMGHDNRPLTGDEVAAIFNAFVIGKCSNLEEDEELKINNEDGKLMMTIRVHKID